MDAPSSEPELDEFDDLPTDPPRAVEAAAAPVLPPEDTGPAGPQPPAAATPSAAATPPAAATSPAAAAPPTADAAMDAPSFAPSSDPVVDPVDALATPSSEDDHSPPHALAPATVALWRTQRLLRLGLMGLPFYGAMAAGLATVAPVWVGATLAAVLAGFSLLMAIVWPPLQYDAYRYAVREQDLLVQSGVLYRRWSSVPLSRIQHVDTRQGPLERMFGVQRLLVYTAAGVSADGVIPALTESAAIALRDALSRRGGDDGV